jgi:glyoxylase-like metal-dependent hydrolase (beta-lactamase superfamily II)
MAYTFARRGLSVSVLLSSSLFLGACAITGDPPEPGGVVHRVQEGASGGNANIYWFQTQSGPIIVDVPLTNGEAKALKKGLERPYRIFVTAARAERFASLDSMREGDVLAVTTPAIATEIRDYGGNRLAAARKREGKDVAGEVTPPKPTIEERTHEMLGETEVEVIPLGPAESESSLAIYLPKTGELITGDVVGGGVHLDLTWGRSAVWQDRINELKALQPKWVYPGHGLPGGPELLDQTLEYLKFFHDAVAARVKPGAPPKISPADKKAIKQQMLAKYGKLFRAELLEHSIPAEYAVQIQALPPTGAAAGATLPSDAPTAPAPNGPGAPPAVNAPPAAATPAPATTDDLLNTDTKSKKKKKSK